MRRDLSFTLHHEDDSSAVGWTQSGWMTANEPSRQQEAVNHGDVENPGQSNRSDTKSGHR